MQAAYLTSGITCVLANQTTVKVATATNSCDPGFIPSPKLRQRGQSYSNTHRNPLSMSR